MADQEQENVQKEPLIHESEEERLESFRKEIRARLEQAKKESRVDPVVLKTRFSF